MPFSTHMGQTHWDEWGGGARKARLIGGIADIAHDRKSIPGDESCKPFRILDEGIGGGVGRKARLSPRSGSQNLTADKRR